MTSRSDRTQPDWVLPAVLVGIGGIVVVMLIVLFAVRSSPSNEDTLAGQMEAWTTCLRSEGAPVPLVEAVGDGGFRVTVDDVVLDAQFESEASMGAFDTCLGDAPEAVQTVAGVLDGISSLPFGGGDLGWLGPLLFDLGGSGVFDGSNMDIPHLGDPPLDELCAQLDGLDLVVPGVADELLGLCTSGTDV